MQKIRRSQELFNYNQKVIEFVHQKLLGNLFIDLTFVIFS